MFTQESEDDFNVLDNRQISFQMEDIVITEMDIKEKLLKLNVDKSPGPDMIHPRVLKEVADQISSALEYVYNISLFDQELPDDWKFSIVST